MVYLVPNLNISQSKAIDCCVRERCVFFLFLLCRPGGSQGPIFFPQEMPRPHCKRYGPSFYASKIKAKIKAPQGGVYSHYHGNAFLAGINSIKAMPF